MWRFFSNAGAEKITVAPVSAMVQLFDLTLGGDAANFDVPSISQSYNHLKIVAKLQADGGTGAWNPAPIRFNGDSGANYFNWVNDWNTGGAPAAATANNAASWALFGVHTNNTDESANEFGVCEGIILDYRSTVGWKQVISNAFHQFKTDANSKAHFMQIAGTWKSTAAINRITLLPQGGGVTVFKAGSRLTIYGIL